MVLKPLRVSDAPFIPDVPEDVPNARQVLWRDTCLKADRNILSGVFICKKEKSGAVK